SSTHFSSVHPTPPHRHPHSFPTRRSSDLLKRHHAATGIWPGPRSRRTICRGSAHQSAGPGAAPRIHDHQRTDLSAGHLLSLLVRSEEHTSELQSRGHLVCRLLLEKKKTNK